MATVVNLYNGEAWEWFPNSKPNPEGWYTSIETYEEANGTNTSNTPDADKRAALIRSGVVEVLKNGNPDDINAGGEPDVRVVEKIIGFDITADERDIAYLELMVDKEKEE